MTAQNKSSKITYDSIAHQPKNHKEALRKEAAEVTQKL